MLNEKKDPLIEKIEREFDFGQYVSYKYADHFMGHLEKLKNEIENITLESPERAVSLYELFLHGCTEKIEEIDDSGGNMGMFFSDLFCSWVKARQKANYPAKETLDLIEKWKEKDDYGLCHRLDKELIEIFDNQTLDLIEGTILAEVEEGLESSKGDLLSLSYDMESKIELIKKIYKQKSKSKAYIEFTEKLGVTTDDCENIAVIFREEGRYSKALEWVEKGLDSQTEKGKSSLSDYQLVNLKKDLLSKLGNSDKALEISWLGFKGRPSSYSYQDLMKYVPKNSVKSWREKVISIIKDGAIEPFFEVCLEINEYELIADRILKTSHGALENFCHYSTDQIAKVLTKEFPEAAAKIYRAQGVRIVKSKKSKYYHIAWEHFEMAKKLYHNTGQEIEWKMLVEKMVREHSRKSSFIGGFREIVAGTKKKKLSFTERAANRWD